MHSTSYFTNVIDVEDGIYVVSLISGSTVFFNGYSLSELNNKLSDENFCEEHSLFVNGIVTKLSLDQEKSFARDLHKKLWKTHKGSYGVVLAPTLLCNLRCTYCYQNDIKKPQRSSMTSEEISIFLEYIQENNIDHVTLYGGEPLLKANKNILEPVLEFIKSSNITCHAITNGTELDSYFEYLGKDCISRIQITLDGDEENHNKFRIKKDGSNSWKQIMGNMKKSIKCGVHVSVRMNVNSENIEVCQAFKKQLENEYRNSELLNCYLGKISGDKGDLSYIDYADAMYHPAMQKFPSMGNFQFYPKASYCSKIARIKSLIFAPSGIWDCWHYVGNEAKKTSTYMEFKKSDDMKYNDINEMIQFSEPCISCKYIFICSGDCLVYKNKTKSCDIKKQYKIFHENTESKLENHRKKNL